MLIFIEHRILSTIRSTILTTMYTYIHYVPFMKFQYDMYHCCVYIEKLLMMDRGTVRNM